MKLNIYAIYDRVAKTYMAPFFARSDVEAIRQIAASLRDPSLKDTPIVMNPSDFDLNCLGRFDDESGELSPQTAITVRNANGLVSTVSS